jgi:sugar lactone lactonase YvrE
MRENKQFSVADSASYETLEKYKILLIFVWRRNMKKIVFFKYLFSIVFMFTLAFAHADPVVTKLWESKADFKLPESVLYDEENNILYVSNVGDGPYTKSNNGFISKVDLEGNITELKWVEGLNSPKGLAMFEKKLYVSDIAELVEIDINSGKILNKYSAPGANFLNDVTVDNVGNVYISDMFLDKIYQLNKVGQLITWLYTPELEAPNGLHYENDQIIVGSWGHLTNGFAPSVVGHLKTVSIESKKIKSLGNAKPVGTLDGVESDGNGAYFVTDWAGGNLLHISADGNFKVIAKLVKGAADHEVIYEKNMIIVPLMNDNKLVAYKIK